MVVLVIYESAILNHAAQPALLLNNTERHRPAERSILMAFDFRAYAWWCGLLYTLAGLLFVGHYVLTRLSRRVGNRCTLAKLTVASDAGRFIILWYAISISMTMYNKWFLTIWRGGFGFPVSISLIHMITKLVLSRGSIFVMGGHVAPLCWATYIKQAVPIGASTGIDIMLSNLSFLYVSVHFYTIAKSGSVCWVLFFSLCLGLIMPSCSLLAVVLFIFAGISTASMGEIHFQWVGLAIVLLAGMMGGFRWALTQLFLKTLDKQHADASPESTSTNRLSTLDLVYHISPASALSLLPAAFIMERHKLAASKFIAPLVRTAHNITMSQSGSHAASVWEPAATALCLSVIGGIVAFALIVVEVKVVQKTSALSLSVAGNFKDVTQICLSVAIFHEQITALNIVGLLCAIAGISIYTHSKVRVAANEQLHRSPQSRIKAQYTAENLSDIEVTRMLRSNSSVAGTGDPMAEILQDQDGDGKITCLLDIGQHSDSEDECDLCELQEVSDLVCL